MKKLLFSLFVCIFSLIHFAGVFAYSEDNWTMGYSISFPTNFSEIYEDTNQENSSSSTSGNSSSNTPSSQVADHSQVPIEVPNPQAEATTTQSTEVPPTTLEENIPDLNKGDQEVNNKEVSINTPQAGSETGNTGSATNPEEMSLKNPGKTQGEPNTKEVQRTTSKTSSFETKLAKNESIKNNVFDQKNDTKEIQAIPVEEAIEQLHGSAFPELPKYKTNILPYYLIIISLILLSFLITLKKTLHAYHKSAFILHKISK